MSEKTTQSEAVVCGSVAWLVVESRIRDLEVASSSLTHCAVECGPAQAAQV